MSLAARLARRPNSLVASPSWFVIGLVCLMAGGCPMAAPPSVTPDPKDNSTFQNATPVEFNASDISVFTGSVGGSDTVDLYSLGTLATGDFISIDVRTIEGNLDPVAALFDANENVHAFNDDRIPDASDLNPRIDVFVRGAEGEYFLGVAPFPSTGTSGRYRVEVQISRDAGDPGPTGQIVFLDWAGGQNIEVPNVGVFNLPPFDAAVLGPFQGQTQQIKTRVQEIVANRFAGFALTLLNSDANAMPAEPHSTVYFGGTSRQAFAISEAIDTQNANPDDKAIVFTGSFRSTFSEVPTVEQMATAIGNTTAHEIGHLLGLVHTRDCQGIMDTTCGNDSILVEQAFKRAPLDRSVFPLGFQDAVELLTMTLGLAGI